MKAEYTAEDFTKAVKNPYFDKLNRKVEVAVRHETYDLFKKIASQNNVEPEVIMKRCLEKYAVRLAED
jgi:predicted outer membrane protein